MKDWQKCKSQVFSGGMSVLLMLLSGGCAFTFEENSISGNSNTVEEKSETKQDTQTDIKASIPAI